MTDDEFSRDFDRVCAMVKEWCRILGKDPDKKIRSSGGKKERYFGYVHLMCRLLDAADAVGKPPRP